MSIIKYFIILIFFSILHNQAIAEEIKNNGKVAPRYFDEASILFCDIVGFTKLTETLPPNTLVELLDQIFCRFDTLAAKHSVE